MKNQVLQKNIPKEWQQIKLGDVCDIKKGEQLNRLDMVVGAEFPALNGGINPSGYTNSWNTESNTITISEGGNSCGYVNFMVTRFWCGGHCYAIKDIKEYVMVDFLYQSLKSQQDELMKLRVGSGLPNIQKKSIENFTLIIPSIAEQKKIAEILTSIDDEIRKTDEIISQTEKLKTGLTQKIFSEDINENIIKWMRLGDVCVTSSGGTPLKSNRGYYENGTIPWLTSGEVRQGHIRTSKQFITKQGLENSSAKMFPKNTILIAMYGATAGQIGLLDFESSTNQAICGILPNNKFNPEFLYQFLLTKTKTFINQAVGAAQPNISQSVIRDTFIPILGLEKQNKIAEIISSIDSEILINVNLKSKLLELKKGLASDLLSGKVRTINN